MTPEIKIIPIAPLLGILKTTLTKRADLEVLNVFDQNWWFDLISYAVEVVIAGSCSGGNTEYFDEFFIITDELEVIGYTTEEAKQFVADWEQYVGNYLAKFNVGPQVGNGVVDYAIRAAGVGNNYDANSYLYITIGTPISTLEAYITME